MAQDSVPHEDGTDQSDKMTVEERLSALEERNQELEAKLEQQGSGGLSNVTRRGALGVLGGGVLLGAAGSASAANTSDRTVDPVRETPDLGVVERPVTTTGDIELDVGDGYNQTSLQAAFNKIPHHVQHEVRIHVHGRTSDQNTAHIHSVQMANHVDFVVDGDDNGIVNDGGVNVDIMGKLDHIQFDNLEFEFLSQVVDARFDNCVFGGNGRACFSGKMGGKMLINCDFRGGNDYAISSIGDEAVEIRNCTLRGDEAAVRGTAASMHVFTGDNVINAPQKYTGFADEVYVSGRRVD